MTRTSGAVRVVRDAPVPTVVWYAGTTLMELIVVLALVGLLVGVSGLTLASLRPAADAQATQDLRRARAEAIRTGRPVRLSTPPPDSEVSSTPPSTSSWTFLPDGRALGPGVDPLTGVPR